MVESLRNALDVFLSYIPQLIGAIVILIVGYVVAKVLQAVVSRVLQAVGFDNWMERGGIKQFFDRAQTRETPATVLGRLVFWFVFIIAITMAADALGIQQVSTVLAQLIAYIPSIIAAILILVLAALLANFLASIVRGATGSDLFSNIARYAIIIYAAFAAITELGIAVQLTAPTFLIILGAVALAAAIAFGFGAQGVARDIVEKAYERREEAKQKVQQAATPDRTAQVAAPIPGTRGLRSNVRCNGDHTEPRALAVARGRSTGTPSRSRTAGG
jgi:small-conductance mechanosensitive channel